MVRVVFGTGLPREGTTTVPAVTLGEAIDQLEQAEPWLTDRSSRWFVNGVDADQLEGPKTPVGEEDTVLVWHPSQAADEARSDG